MPEPANDKIQPCLLDRLTDLQPDKQRESSQDRVMSSRRYREAVFRDLQMLLTTGRPDFDNVDLAAYPECATSVLRYGVVNLAGSAASSLDHRQLAQELRDAIAAFEPRINPSSLSVELIVDHWNQANNEVMFEIRGVLWANPAPQDLLIRTKLDVESGDFTLTDGKP